jgi:hypothetical protein
MYLSCYQANQCNPNTSCGTDPTGVCGVNTIGGGQAPLVAAVVTYNCVCP